MRKRYVMRDRKLVEVPLKRKPSLAHNVMGDIDPYWSVASNRMIGSRSTRREDLKATGCREVDPSEKKQFLAPKKHEDFKFDDKDLHHFDKMYRGERID